MLGQPSLSFDELSNVEEEEMDERKSTTSDESSSLLGMWNDFFHQSFSSLATTTPMEGKQVSSDSHFIVLLDLKWWIAVALLIDACLRQSSLSINPLVRHWNAFSHDSSRTTSHFTNYRRHDPCQYRF